MTISLEVKPISQSAEILGDQANAPIQDHADWKLPVILQPSAPRSLFERAQQARLRHPGLRRLFPISAARLVYEGNGAADIAIYASQEPIAHNWQTGEPIFSEETRFTSGAGLPAAHVSFGEPDGGADDQAFPLSLGTARLLSRARAARQGKRLDLTPGEATRETEPHAASFLGVLALPILDGLRRFSPSNKSVRRLLNGAVIGSLVASCIARQPEVNPASREPSAAPTDVLVAPTQGFTAIPMEPTQRPTVPPTDVFSPTPKPPEATMEPIPKTWQGNIHVVLNPEYDYGDRLVLDPRADESVTSWLFTMLTRGQFKGWTVEGLKSYVAKNNAYPEGGKLFLPEGVLGDNGQWGVRFVETTVPVNPRGIEIRTALSSVGLSEEDKNRGVRYYAGSDSFMVFSVDPHDNHLIFHDVAPLPGDVLDEWEPRGLARAATADLLLYLATFEGVGISEFHAYSEALLRYNASLALSYPIFSAP